MLPTADIELALKIFPDALTAPVAPIDPLTITLPLALTNPTAVILAPVMLPVALINPAVLKLPPCMFPATVNKLVATSKVNAPVAPATPALLNMT
jgi:hypothetical protein